MLVAGAGALLRGLELGGSFIQLPNPSLCFRSVGYYNSLPDCTKPACSVRIAAGHKGLLVEPEKCSGWAHGDAPSSPGSPKCPMNTLGKRRITLQVACSFTGIFKNLLMLKQNVVNLVRGAGETHNFVSWNLLLIKLPVTWGIRLRQSMNCFDWTHRTGCRLLFGVTWRYFFFFF